MDQIFEEDDDVDRGSTAQFVNPDGVNDFPYNKVKDDPKFPEGDPFSPKPSDRREESFDVITASCLTWPAQNFGHVEKRSSFQQENKEYERTHPQK